MSRRKLGSMLSEPIDEIMENKYVNGVRFIEKDHESAMKSRAAAGMYIYRNKLPLKTVVMDNCFCVRKDKDIEGRSKIVDLRKLEAIDIVQ